MTAIGRATLGAFLLFVSATMVMAAQYPPMATPFPPMAPPYRPGRVARLQYVSGSVSIQPHGTGNWVIGVLNRPLATSDNVWTDKNSRAELSVGAGVLRMNGETSLTLSNISRGTVQVTLHQGTLNLRVFHLFAGEIYEVDTPSMAFTLKKSGEYRFEVNPAGDATVVTVWKGQGTATGDGPAVRVRAQEQARFTGTSLAHEIHRIPRRDGFDGWCEVRDQREEHSLFGSYVAPGMIGYPAPPGVIAYPPPGAIGYPAPYRYGPWVWVGPWGWTWGR
jgi:hypothetical protein